MTFQKNAVEFCSNPLRQYCTVRVFHDGLEYVLQRTEKCDTFMVLDGWQPKLCMINNENIKVKQALENALNNPQVKAWVKKLK